ncbi:MAG: tyrosine-type recombinase/integrase [Candidatus Sungbacteria bacterium]|uniref:Tyrosine-type recombinase/integrase n=1 Tax=Candidatus Sungiibacteriota bacterium TaxID=2750080 RepID=A0A932VPG6_9BACT|nr:tyrosine-type recombinase/integrase [Candidatus Sungbacteria bacterium]
MKINNYSAETLYNYERDLAVFDRFLDEDVKTLFTNISKRTIELYKAYLASRDRITAGRKKTPQKLSAGSVNRALSSLRAYLKYLVDTDETIPIPPEAVKLIKMPRPHARVAELEALISLIQSPVAFEKTKEVALRNRAILETLFATGMRISELVSLNRDQIDKSGRIFVRGKGKKERFVYLTARAQEHIKNYMDMRDDENPALFIPYRGRNMNKSSARISTNYVQMKMKQYRTRLGINVPTSPHSLRHGFATYLAEQGANPAAIQILLGHESLHTTTRYVHASDKYAEKTHKQFHPLKK